MRRPRLSDRRVGQCLFTQFISCAGIVVLTVDVMHKVPFYQDRSWLLASVVHRFVGHKKGEVHRGMWSSWPAMRIETLSSRRHGGSMHVVSVKPCFVLFQHERETAARFLDDLSNPELRAAVCPCLLTWCIIHAG